VIHLVIRANLSQSRAKISLDFLGFGSWNHSFVCQQSGLLDQSRAQLAIVLLEIRLFFVEGAMLLNVTGFDKLISAALLARESAISLPFTPE